MKTRRVLDNIYRFINRRPVYHGLFWVALFGLMLWTDHEKGMDMWFALSNELIQLFFYAFLVYLNLFYLIPNYLARHAFVYFGLVLGACAIVTPIEVLFFYLKFYNEPVYQAKLVGSQLWVFLGNLFVVILATVLRVIMDWWRYQTEKQTLLTQTMQSELRFLKSQINPHFLFNTLNNLYALTLKKSDKAPDIVLKLSEIMRYMLYECNERRVLLSKEIQYIHNYLDLERLRQPKEADIRFTTQGHISEQMVAPLLFVPFLENSFKHGLNHHVQGGGFVRLRLSVSGEDMEFFIENSKVERIPRQNHPRSGGIGLTNVRQRLELLYPENHTLTVQDEPHRYAVTLHLRMT
ncbi:MAG: histidine kinase [Lewinellaceae bacterium]|jgi:two-component system LytT family sensor kinase|nr:histidine kinase [Lewinellaceae bacterium]